MLPFGIMADSYTSHSLRIFENNIYMGFANAKTVGLTSLVDNIVDVNANLILLSETDDVSTNEITSMLNSRGGLWYVANGNDTGVISKFKIIDFTSSEYYVKSVINTGFGIVVVYSCHLDWLNYAPYLPRGYGGGARSGITSSYGWERIPSGPITDSLTIKSVNDGSLREEIISQIIEDSKSETVKGRSIIIGGDFNEPSHLDWTMPNSNKYGRNDVVFNWSVSEKLALEGYSDSYRVKYPNTETHPGITWPCNVEGVAPSQFTEIGADVRDRIDYIYYKGSNLSVVSSNIVGPSKTISYSSSVNDTDSGSVIPPKLKWYTDHRAVFTELEII